MNEIDPILKRLESASDERLVVLSNRRVTRHTRRILERIAAQRGVTLAVVDNDGFPIRSGASPTRRADR